MKFKAINTKGKVVYGDGVVRGNEYDIDDREIGYMINGVFEFIDMTNIPYYGEEIEYIFLDTVELIKEL